MSADINLTDAEIARIGAMHSTEEQFGRSFTEEQFLAAVRAIFSAHQSYESRQEPSK